MEDNQKTRQDNLSLLVVLFISIRLVVNASYRMIYPFLRAFASGIGISVQTASLPLTGRSLAGAFAPLLAPFADRYGRKKGMLLGLALFSLGVGLVGIWPSFPAFSAALILTNLGNLVFVPSMQAYLGDRVAFQRRGRILALTELAWSLSFILLVPLAGLLVARLGWAAPFWVLAGLGILSFGFLAWKVPGDHSHRSTQTGALWHSLRQVFASPDARTALLFGLSITLANELVNFVFGVWMSDAFGLQIAALGLAAMVIGAAELSGEAATVMLVDRVGKKRAVRVGVIFTSLAALTLPVMGQTLWGALAGLFLFYLGFEFTLVSFIPLMTEVLPEARATLMATNLAANSLGRAIGAQAGFWLYTIGFGANAFVALLVNGLALLLLSRLKLKE
ncbi:MAG: MFS transporter [Anaerolineaceae bacterium]|nr:MFS transporter [Anaerolineaceae bacterium]